MLKKRIIPKFLLMDGRFVKGKRFDEDIREAGNPVATSKTYQAYGIDELMILHIGENRLFSDLEETIQKLSENIFMPLTVGGGVATIDSIRRLLLVGADKVCITTAAIENPNFIGEAAQRFGSSTITVCIDYRIHGQQRLVYSHNGRKISTWTVNDFVDEMLKQGAGELVINCIDNDGMMKGYDCDFIAEVADRILIPVVASSGAGSLNDCLEMMKTQVSAITISSMFIFSDHSPIKLRSFLRSNGIEVRASHNSRN